MAESKDPRANQKARTRGALVEAARALMRAGAPPTVGEAAGAARVSRATAYRYFPTQESLLLEIASIGPAVQPVEEVLGGLSGPDPAARLARLVDAFNPIMLAEEAPMRGALRTYLDLWLEGRRRGERAPRVREGRRIDWLDRALQPLRRALPAARWRRLRAALALTLGIEAVVVMKDVARLGDREALEVLRWAALALLRAGLADAVPPRSARR